MTSTVIAQTTTSTGSKKVSESHLRTAERVFGHLTCTPQPPLALDCDALSTMRRLPAGTLPRGSRSLAELRDWLIENPKAYLARDVIWREVAVRARAGEQGWMTGAVGLAMPALVRSARHYTAGYHGDAADIANEILLGFLTALKDPELQVERPALFVKLCWAAWRSGRALRLADDRHIPVEEVTPTGNAGKPKSSAPREPWQHVDLLVHRAAALGLIECDDVESWLDARLGGKAVALLAEGRGLATNTLRMRLKRVDAGIAEALEDGLLTTGFAAASHTRAKALAAAAAKTPATVTVLRPRDRVTEPELALAA